jgi:regulator of ribosome biosynthesis
MNSNDLVKDILRRDIVEQDKILKSTEVIKPCPVDVDLGNLLVWDPNIIDQQAYKENKDEYILNTMRDNMQLLVNALWQVPIERHDNAVVAKLPDSKTIVPRAKPVPKPKPLSKWQKFAQSKGIVKQKKGKFVWDEQKKEWGRRYGFKKANDESKDWLIEVPSSADPNEDQFAKRQAAKKERVAKNEFQRLKNLAHAKKINVRNDGAIINPKSSVNDVKKALATAKYSDASMGQFSERIAANEDQQTRGFSKKRKYESNLGSLKSEKDKQLKLFEQLGAAAVAKKT